MSRLRAGEQLLELVYPRRCPFCDEVIGRQKQCRHCDKELKELWLKIPRLPATEHRLDGLSGAASILAYDGLAQEAILRMKNGGRACYAKLFAAEMAKRIFGCTLSQKGGIIFLDRGLLLRTFDLVLPVPASKGSRRGYNVPDLLARRLAEYLEAGYRGDLLVKIRNTGKQEGKTAQQRLHDLKGAFRVLDTEQVEGRRILLVDDVITTGGTVSECACELMKAGALDVFAVSVAETQFKG